MLAPYGVKNHPLRRMSQCKLKVGLDWMGRKYPGGVKYRAAYAANNKDCKMLQHKSGHSEQRKTLFKQICNKKGTGPGVKASLIECTQ